MIDGKAGGFGLALVLCLLMACNVVGMNKIGDCVQESSLAYERGQYLRKHMTF